MIQFSVQILLSSVPFNKSYFSRKGSEDAKKINTPLNRISFISCLLNKEARLIPGKGSLGLARVD